MVCASRAGVLDQTTTPSPMEHGVLGIVRLYGREEEGGGGGYCHCGGRGIAIVNIVGVAITLHCIAHSYQF